MKKSMKSSKKIDYKGPGYYARGNQEKYIKVGNLPLIRAKTDHKYYTGQQYDNLAKTIASTTASLLCKTDEVVAIVQPQHIWGYIE